MRKLQPISIWDFRQTAETFATTRGEQSVKSFTIAADLLRHGAKKKLIIDEIFRNKTYRSVQFMQHLLQRMQKIKI